MNQCDVGRKIRQEIFERALIVCPPHTFSLGLKMALLLIRFPRPRWETECCPNGGACGIVTGTDLSISLSPFDFDSSQLGNMPVMI